MKENENTTLIQSLYAAFGRGDIAFILDRVTPDAQWDFEAPANIPYAGQRKGPAEIAGFFQGLDSGCTDMNLAPEHFVAQSDLVATFGRFWGTAKATGKRFDVPYAHSFTVRDGKVAEFANFGDTAALSSAFGSL